MDNNYKEINSKFCGMIGYDREELYKFKFPEPFWPQQFFQGKLNEIELYKQTGLLKIETYFCRKNKTYFPVQLFGSIIPESGINGIEYVMFFEDITDQKKAEREYKLSQEMLIALNNKLERLVKKRTEQLHLTMKQKNEFINQLGHDLKNPLNPMINLIPILQKKAPNNECKEILSVLMRNVLYMRNLVINTIELAKLDSPNIQFSFEKINLKQEIESILHNNFMIKNEKNIAISFQIEDTIWVDVDKLRFNELIINTVENAIKYGKENGTIFVIGKKNDDKTVQIRIVDDGCGMTEDQLQYVFHDFYRVDHQNSTFKSSGLGMSICKRIVEKHGGTILCKSPGLGKGTTVECNLPIKHKKFEDEEINLKMEHAVSSIKEI